jgi:hypothetical protein
MGPSRIQFVEWWLKTGFGLQSECRDTLHWDGKKTSDSWKHFEQVANKRTGEPKAMCKRCLSTLAHPGYKRTGTSVLRAHLRGGTCNVDRRKQDIIKLIQNSVSPFYNY